MAIRSVLRGAFTAQQSQPSAQLHYRESAPRFMPGIVTNEGPNGEPDYVDARYWIRAAFVQTPAQAGEIKYVPYSLPHERTSTFTAFNIAEHETGSHSLTAGTAIAFSWFDSFEREPKRLYWFDRNVGGGAEVRVVAIRDSVSEFSWFVIAQEILPSDTKPWDGTFKFAPDTIQLICWPTTRGHHYQRLAYGGSDPNDPTVQGCRLETWKGALTASPFVKIDLSEFPKGSPLRVSDCHPLLGL